MKSKYLRALLLSISVCTVAPMAYAYADTGIVVEDLNGSPEYTYTIEVNGTMLPINAQKLLDRINEYRKEACDKGYFGLTPADYKPLKWNTKLEEMARLRAVEASIFANHDKPDGVNEHPKYYQENLAWNHLKNQDPIHAINLLASEKKYYERYKEKFTQGVAGNGPEYMKIGHYTAIISPYNRLVAVASFHLNEDMAVNSGYSGDPVHPSKNYTTTAMTFGSGSGFGASQEQLPDPISGNHNYKIDIFSQLPNLSSRGFEVIWPTNKLETGKSYKINSDISFDYFDKDTSAISYVKANMTDGPWKSSDPSVLSVDRDGVIKALKPGKATISLKIQRNDIIDVSKDFIVTGEEVKEVSGDPLDSKDDPNYTISETGKPFSYAKYVKPAPVDATYIFGIPVDDSNPSTKAKALRIKKEAIEKGKNIIDSLKYISQSRKEHYYELIEASEDANDLNGTVDSAIDEDDKIEAKKLKESNVDLSEKLKAFREKTKSKVSLLSDLTSDDVEKFNKLIDENQDLNNFDNILNQAKTRNNEIKAQKAQEAEKLKKKARDEISKLPEIENTEKTQYNLRINVAASPETINYLVNEAKELSKVRVERKERALVGIKEKAIEELYSLKYLPDDIKKNYEKTINSKKEKQTVESALRMAKGYNDELGGESEKLNDVKPSYEEKLAAFTDLNEEDLEYFKDKIKYAIDENAMKAAVAKAEAKNLERQEEKKELEGLKETISQEIKAKEGLTKEQAEELNTALGSAKNKEEAEAVRSKIEAKIEENKKIAELAAEKEKAKSEVAALEELSESELAAFNSNIENAQSKEDLEPIVNSAKEKSQANKKAKAEEIAKEQENQGGEVTTGEQESGSESNEEGTATPAEQPIVTPATDGSQTADGDAQGGDTQGGDVSTGVSGSGETNNTESGGGEDSPVQPGNNQGETVSTQPEKDQDALDGENSLNTAKEDGKTKVNDLKNLSDQQKEEYASKIEEANSKDDVNTILSSAKEKDDSIVVITYFKNLSPSEKKLYINKINSVNSVEEIKQIVEMAKAADTEKAKQNEEQLGNIEEENQSSETTTPNTEGTPAVGEPQNGESSDSQGAGTASEAGNIGSSTSEREPILTNGAEGEGTPTVGESQNGEVSDSQGTGTASEAGNTGSSTSEREPILTNGTEGEGTPAVGESQNGEVSDSQGAGTASEVGNTGSSTSEREPILTNGTEGEGTPAVGEPQNGKDSDSQGTGTDSEAGNAEAAQRESIRVSGNKETINPQITVTPKDKNLIVTKVEGVSQETLASINSPEAKAQVEAMIKGDYDVYEVTLESSYNENETYLVGIPYDASKEVIKVAHIRDNGSVEFFEKNNFTIRDGKVYVNAKGLSPFIIEYGANAKAEMPQFTHKTAVKTGDDTPLTMSVMFTMAFAALAGLFIRKKNK